MVFRPEEIILEVASSHGILVSKLLSKSRKRMLVTARKEAIRRVYEETDLSATEVAELFGYADHTTVLHHLKP